MCSFKFNRLYSKTTDWYLTKDLKTLFQAEDIARRRWILSIIQSHFGRKVKMLDINAKSGFLTNHFADLGHLVTGVNSSRRALDLAESQDASKSVRYHLGDPAHLPFNSRSFEVVLALDILEQTQEPERIVNEASRLLCHRGLFFFHTVNRSLLSYFLIIKAMGWLIKEMPPNSFSFSLFLTPEELSTLCEKAFLMVRKKYGLVPQMNSALFLKMLKTREIPSDISFKMTSSLLTGYGGYAIKEDTRVKSHASVFSSQGFFAQEGI